MLRLNPSAPLPGMDPAKVPCVQCDRREYGLSWGEFCSLCREERRVRADRIAQRAAVGAAVVMAAGIFWQTAAQLNQRIFGAVSVVLVYFIVRRFVSRLVQEFWPKANRPSEEKP